MGRMVEAQRREREHLLAHMGAIKGFMPLLMKRRNGGRWSRQERQELRVKLNALAYLSPYLVVLMLPGSILALPVLAWWLDRRRLRRKDARGSGGSGGAASLGAS